ncbi:MAG: RNA methyltransferase [Pseudomonadota bacterium]
MELAPSGFFDSSSLKGSIVFITSLQNQHVKELLKLRDSKGRREQKRFLVEGAREVGRALLSGYKPSEIWFSRDVLSSSSSVIINSAQNTNLIEVSQNVFSKLAVREDKDGIIAVFPVQRRQLSEFKREAKGGLLMVVQGLEKPGNFGAMLRTADGLGVTAVIVLDSSSDIWSPIAIRTSLGTIFSIPVFESSSLDFLSFVRQEGFKTYAALLDAKAQSVFDTKFEPKSAILMGAEDTGLSDFWVENADVSIVIPMYGIADSFNVSVAASLILFEAKRQSHKTEA